MLFRVLAATGIAASALLLTGCFSSPAQVGVPTHAAPDCPELPAAAFDLTDSDEVSFGDTGIAENAGLSDLIDGVCFYSIVQDGADRGMFYIPRLSFDEADAFMDKAEQVGDDHGFTTLGHGPIRTAWGMNSVNKDTGVSLAIVYFEQVDGDVFQGAVPLEDLGMVEGDSFLVGIIGPG